MTVWAGINFGLLFDNLGVIIALTVGLMALKVAVLYLLSVIFKLGGSDRWLFSLGPAQVGEFGFVLLSFTVASAVIPEDLAERPLLIVALSMLLTPALYILFDRIIAPRFSAREEREMNTIEEKSEIIIAGHGRVGGIVSRILRSRGLTPTVMDFSSKQLELLKVFDVQAYYGDATRPDLLHAAGIGDAKLIVIAIDGKEQITELAKYVLHHYPDLHIVVRAVDRNHVYNLWSVGCRDIIRDTYDSSLRMGRSAIEALGHSRDQAERIVEVFNKNDRRIMITAAEHYDPDVPAHENESYLAKVREARDEWEADLTAQIVEIMAERGA